MYFKELTVVKLKYAELSEYSQFFSGDGRFTTFDVGGDKDKRYVYVRDSVINEEEGYAVGTLLTYSPVKDSFLVRFPVALDPYQISLSRDELMQLAIPFNNGQLTYNLSANNIDISKL